MEDNSLHIWHRCGTCGTIFADLQGLRLHLEQHSGSKRRTSPPDLQNEPISTDLPVWNRKVPAELKK